MDLYIVIIKALLTVPKENSLDVHQWKIQYIHTMEYYSDQKKGEHEAVIDATMWLNLEKH